MRRTAAALVDQAAWAATNFSLVSLLSHQLSAEDFGRVSVPLTIVLLTGGLALAVSGEVVAVTRGAAQRGGSPHTVDLDAVRARAIRRGLAVAALGGTASLAAAAWMDTLGQVPRTGWLLAAAAPVGILAETTRAIAYAEQRRSLAFQCTWGWVAAQSAVILALLATVGLSASGTVLAWTFGGLVSVLAGIRQLGLPRFRVSSSREERRRLRGFAVEYLLTAAPQQLLPILAAGSLGLVATGQLRALATVFGPLNIAIAGIRNLLLPSLSAHRNRLELLRPTRTVAAGGVAVTAAATAALLVVPSLGPALMSDAWPSSMALVVAFGASRAATAGAFGALLVLRATDSTRLSSTLRYVTAATSVGAFVVAMPWGLLVSVAAFAVTMLLGAGAWWTVALRTIRTEVPSRGSAPRLP